MPVGALAQLDRRAALDRLMPGGSSPELVEGDNRVELSAHRSARTVPVPDRRAVRPRAEVGMSAAGEGPFDDAA